MTFQTQSELIATSTGLFYDNTVGAITPSSFREMNEHFADSIVKMDASGVFAVNTTPSNFKEMNKNFSDSMIPYDSSGVFQISTIATGNVPTPTPTGAMVFSGATSDLYIFDGTNWLTFSSA